MTEFGRDLSCTTGLRTGRFVSGARLVAEAAFRRLTTPRGTLRGGEEEANYGLDIADLIGAVGVKNLASSIGGLIRNELLKDERITAVSVDVVMTQSGPATGFELTVACSTGLGPFSLNILVTDVTVELLGITAES